MMTGMELSIAEIIKRERRQRGWDQAELARRLSDIGQQAVSRWERGLSRPRRSMVAEIAELFELDAAALLEAAGYPSPIADTPEQVSRPVRPRATILPLAELAPDRFEQFTADLAQLLYPEAKVHRVGGQGHTQYGVDVTVKHSDGSVTGIQCKRERQFGPSDVRRAVDAVDGTAMEYILFLTRPAASPEARREIDNHSPWALWDADDISRSIRSRLSLDAATRLVDTYFPGWREPFLGVREPGPWLTTDEFFRPTSGEQLYSHDWEMVGRSEELEGIESFLADEQKKLAVLIGRGGIGKTRLLLALATYAERAQSMEVRFVAASIMLRSEHFELLPATGRLLVIVDDAHERIDIAELVAGVSRTRPTASFLLALRPYGLAQLASDLRRVGLHPTDFPSWELEDLKDDDAEKLAREILGPGFNEGIVRRLASLTTDCPLITVVGAGLIKRGLLSPGRLELADSIRAEILSAFRDAVVADPTASDPTLRGAVLDAIASLQPVRTGEASFRSAMEELTGVPFDRIVPHLRSLEDAGVLLRRGQSLRIVPDLLGDVILAQSSFDERSGTTTGYVERVHRASGGEALQNVLVNVSRVDWHVRQGYSGAPSLVDSLWSAVEAEFYGAGIHGRKALLHLLRKVAFFQPDRALSLARWALEHPTETIEDVDHVLAFSYAPSYEDVVRELPPLLKNVAFNLDYIGDAADLLWELAQRDARPTNQYPEHAVRVLTDLAEYHVGKPLIYNEAVIDAAERWFSNEQLEDLLYSPFDVLETLLATEGSDHSSDGFKILFKPYTVNVDTVQRLRDRVIDLALSEVRSPNPRRAVRAVTAIAAAVHYPMGLFGRSIAEDEHNRWTPIFVDTIDRLADAVADEDLDPVIAVAARIAVHWHATYSHSDTKLAAGRTLERLPTSIERDLALALYDGWGHLLSRKDDYEQAEREKRAWFEKVATALVVDRSDDEIVSLLENRLRVQRQAYGSGEGSPGPFVWTLVGLQPAVGQGICQRVSTEPTSALLELVPVVLSQLCESQPAEAMGHVHDLLAADSEAVVRHVAHALSWNRGPRSQLLDGELDLLRRFAEHDDPIVRRAAVRAAQVISKSHQAAAVELIARVSFGDAPGVAEELFSSFGPHGDLSWAELAKGQATALLDQLRVCPSIDDYHITAFLSELSKSNPDAVLRLLMDRVELAEQSESVNEFRALPYDWHNKLLCRSHTRFVHLLREVLAWIAARLDSWQRRMMGAEIFRAVAEEFDDAVIDVLDEAIGTTAREQIEAVGAILHEAPRTVVWENVPFVRRVLAAAAKHGEDCLQHVGSGLHAAVTSGVRSGTPGQPFGEDLEQRGRSAEIARTLPRGSIEERFYRSLQASAEQSIQWSMTRDETLVDGRDW